MLERHPEWLSFIEPNESEEGGLSVRRLEIHLPSQNPNIPDPLSIYVTRDKVIGVSWFPMWGTSRWDYDWVFYLPRVAKGPNWVDDASGIEIIVDFLDKFMIEEVAAIYKDDGPWGTRSSGIVSAQDIRDGTFKPGKASTEIHSWKGSLDLSLKV